MLRLVSVATTLLLVLVAHGAPPVEAQSSDSHPIVGTWNLNLHRSSFDPGSGPELLRRRFGIDDEGFLVSLRVTVNGVGNPTFALARAKVDGGDFPVWTNRSVHAFDASETLPGATASWESVDERTLRLTQKGPDGEVMGLSPNTWQVSEDGNTLTVTTSGTNANGDVVHNVEVFDRVRN